MWAAFCGVKSVVVDFYDFNYTMFDFLDSVQIVEMKENLKSY